MKPCDCFLCNQPDLCAVCNNEAVFNECPICSRDICKSCEVECNVCGEFICKDCTDDSYEDDYVCTNCTNGC